MTLRRAFTLPELLTVLAIIAVLMAFLLSSAAAARKQAQQVTCLSNLRQVGACSLLYAQSNRGYPFPPEARTGQPQGQRLTELMFGKLNPPVYLCPADHDPAWSHSYIANGWASVARARNAKRPGVLFGEKRSAQPDYLHDPYESWAENIEPQRHRGGSGTLYSDLHAAVVVAVERDWLIE